MEEQAGGVYRPRNPKASPLYGLVEDNCDRFEGLYDERFAKTHGHWRPVVRQVADALLDCGDLRHGFARIGCENPECRHEMLLAFSCRSRCFCPSCHAKRVALLSWRTGRVEFGVPPLGGMRCTEVSLPFPGCRDGTSGSTAARWGF
jgi:hypothetical protein